MKLTTKSEYAILALIYITRHEKCGFVKIEDVCEKYGISKKYLEQLFHILKQSHYVRTRRGASGGYALARPAHSISMAEIIRIMDGPLAPTESVSQYFFAHTPLEKERKVLKILREIRDYISKTLEHVMLSDLV